MKIFLPVLSSFLCVSLLISCDKDDDPQPQTTKTDHLVSSAWKLETAGLDQDKNGTIDFPVMAIVPSCTADNSISFKRDNTGVTDEGATKCIATDPQTTNLNWSFADAEANVNISNSILKEINGKSKILELNASALSFTKDTLIGGLTMGMIVKLKH